MYKVLDEKGIRFRPVYKNGEVGKIDCYPKGRELKKSDLVHAGITEEATRFMIKVGRLEDMSANDTKYSIELKAATDLVEELTLKIKDSELAKKEADENLENASNSAEKKLAQNIACEINDKITDLNQALEKAKANLEKIKSEKKGKGKGKGKDEDEKKEKK